MKDYRIIDDNNNIIGTVHFDIPECIDKPKQGKKIALCIGHNQGVDQGAFGSAGVSEFDFNKKFLDELLPYLPPNNEYKIFKRPSVDSYTVQQDTMHNEIKEWGECDIAIEFHFNAFSNPTTNGHEILYLTEEGKELALKLDEMYDTCLPNNDRNVRLRDSGDGYGFLKRGSYTSLIVEPFFASHQQFYVGDTPERAALIRSYIDFFNSL